MDNFLTNFQSVNKKRRLKIDQVLKSKMMTKETKIDLILQGFLS